MPKQVWEADDGVTFDNENECLRYEKLLTELGGMFNSFENDVRAIEKNLGFQPFFGGCITDGFGFGGFSELWKYRDSLIKLAKMLEG